MPYRLYSILCVEDQITSWYQKIISEIIYPTINRKEQWRALWPIYFSVTKPWRKQLFTHYTVPWRTPRQLSHRKILSDCVSSLLLFVIFLTEFFKLTLECIFHKLLNENCTHHLPLLQKIYFHAIRNIQRKTSGTAIK